ncbi:serine hydroxymethyltransferase [Streptomyces sp. NPDC004227]
MQLAAGRAKALFGAVYAQVWPHAGPEANAMAMSALLTPGDTVLGLNLALGADLGRPTRPNRWDGLYEVATYQLRTSDLLVDMDQVYRLAKRRRPKMITAGWSAYPRRLDYARFREIADEVDALLMVDMANVAGPVAAGLHPSPVPHAHVVTTAGHLTLGGAVLTGDPRIARRLDASALPDRAAACAPGMAARAAAYRFAASPAFRERQVRALRAARIVAGRLLADDVAEAGVRVLTGSTETDRVLVSLRNARLEGRPVQEALHMIGITVNRTAVSFEPRTPARSGLSIDTAALAARGFSDTDFRAAAETIARILTHAPRERLFAEQRPLTATLTKRQEPSAALT